VKVCRSGRHRYATTLKQCPKCRRAAARAWSAAHPGYFNRPAEEDPFGELRKPGGVVTHGERCGVRADAHHRRYYSDRGIGVCSTWQDSYSEFLKDVGRAPSPKHTLDRIDPTKGYAQGNVRWATMLEQRHNRRPDSKQVGHLKYWTGKRRDIQRDARGRIVWAGKELA
jgi:hypothetical protein